MNERLAGILNSSRPPHALLLTGANEKTRKKEALSAAAAFICESGVKRPCGKCAACKKAKAGSHPDIITVIPTAKNAAYKKDDIKITVIEKLYVAPNEAERKVYIINEANKLSAVIQNNLLKSIEEPPSFVGFVFTSPSKEFLLETIRSRVTEVRLDEADSDYKQAGEEKTTTVKAIASAVASKSEYAILRACAGIKKNRQYIAEVCSLLIIMFRDALVNDASVPTMTGEERTAASLSLKCSEKELLGAVQAAKEIILASQSNANENLMLTGLSVGLSRAVCGETRKES